MLPFVTTYSSFTKFVMTLVTVSKVQKNEETRVDAFEMKVL